jgi:iron(III) transport system substrate-binding protein
MTLRHVFILLAFAAILALPFALRPKDNLVTQADETLVIISPHNEAIRHEFSRGFRDWHLAKTGRTARIDWRIPGGAAEIARYLDGEFQPAFERHWRKDLKQTWTEEVSDAFDDPKTKLGADPAKDLIPASARRAFLESNVGIGIDLLFGGGSYDFTQQAAAGRLVDAGFVQAHPEIFNEGPEGIPQTLGGEVFYDQGGRWFGTVLSAFGVCYNVNALARLQIPEPPQNWADLANPRYFGQVALADPNKSGSVAKAFEMIIQQQMQADLFLSFAITNSTELSLSSIGMLGLPPDEQQAAIEQVERVARQRREEKLAENWSRAMRLILRMGANTRYFADAAPRIVIDMGDGDAAIGMAIDFYGRFQAENSRDPRTGRERLRYFNPPGGTSIGVDPIGLLRGAPHRELALSFMEYVMSLDGQKLWNFKVGAPGGPQKYALRRLPIRKELYAPESAALRSDPDVFPYEEAQNFTYHPEWTGTLFNSIRFIVRVMCVDPHEEARSAWAALIAAKFPPEATAAFEDVSAVNYEQASGHIKDILRASNRLNEVRLAKEMSEHFREQYRRAEALARAGK